MKRLLAAAAFCALGAGLPAALAAGELPVLQQQLINLNLMQALVSIGEERLAGVFSFVPEASAAPALADFLFHDRGSLKRFVKKGEKDLKEFHAINEWDKQVFLYIQQLNDSPALPAGADKLSPNWAGRVSNLILAPGIPLADMTAGRGKR